RRLRGRHVIRRFRLAAQPARFHVARNPDNFKRIESLDLPDSRRRAETQLSAQRRLVRKILADESLVDDYCSRMVRIVLRGELPAADERRPDGAKIVPADRVKI